MIEPTKALAAHLAAFEAEEAAPVAASVDVWSLVGRCVAAVAAWVGRFLVRPVFWW